MAAFARQGKRAEYSRADQALAPIGQDRETIADRIGFKRCAQPFTAEEREEQVPRD
jgi:hypothetical protein